MRRWFCYVLESYDKDIKEGNVLMFPYYTERCRKGQVSVLTFVNVDTLEYKKSAKVIGMGYADFRNEDDLNERLGEVVKKKLKELNIIRYGEDCE